MKMNKKWLIAVLAIALLVGGVSAAVIQWFGQIKVTTTVKQAVLVDGKSYPEIIEQTPTVGGGESFCRHHYLKSQTSVPVELQFVTAYVPVLVEGIEYGITTNYYKLFGFSDSKNTDATTISVEDLGCKVQWTITVDWDKVPFGASHAATALMIGDKDNNILYQIHNNDGVDPDYDVVTWLYSKYENGWYTGGETANNILVSDLDWVEASGGLETDGNIITITIDKTHLAFDEFKWVLRVPQEFTHPEFGWGDTDMTNTDTATVGEAIPETFTLEAGERLDFCICYDFDLLIQADTYTITTTVEPA